MSNAVAVATVTETLTRIVDAAAKSAVAAAGVTNAPPEPPPANNPTMVGVYLYQVAENPAFRPADLPTRNQGGAVLTKPQIALELDFLLSFYGAAAELEPERMLGSVVSVLHSRPLLSPEAIQSAIDGKLVGDPNHFLGDSDLPQQVEGVRITPLYLDLEERSKLWSIFFQQRYTLSVAYRVSVVLIEADESTLKGLPVTSRQVKVVPSTAPQITAVSPQSVPYSATGALMTLHGTGLAADRTVVYFDGVAAAPRTVTDQTIVVPIPLTLPAGVHVVHVAHLVDWGTPSVPDLRPILDSNRVAFALQPDIVAGVAAIVAPGPLAATVNPELQPDQVVRLVLSETGNSAADAPPKFFEVEQRVTQPGRSVSFDLTGAPTGEFWLRVAVDDVTSSLAFDDTGFTGPRLDVS